MPGRALARRLASIIVANNEHARLAAEAKRRAEARKLQDAGSQNLPPAA